MTTGRINQVTVHTTGEGPPLRPDTRRHYFGNDSRRPACGTPERLREQAAGGESTTRRSDRSVSLEVSLPRVGRSSQRSRRSTAACDNRLPPRPLRAARAARGQRPQTILHGRHLPRHIRTGQQRAHDTETPRGSGPEARHSSSAALSPPCKGGAAGRCNRAYDGHGQPDLSRQSSNSRAHGEAASHLPAGSGHRTRPGNRGRARRSVRRTPPPPLSQRSLYLPDRRGEPSVGVPPSDDRVCRRLVDTARAEDREAQLDKSSAYFPTTSLPPDLVGTGQAVAVSPA